MATIDSLMEGKKPGEIKICLPQWPAGSYFRPYYVALFFPNKRYWFGTCVTPSATYDPANFTDTASYSAEMDNWQLYDEVREQMFRPELIELLKQYGKQNGSNTPDFILAQFLIECLEAWDRATIARTNWGGK
jgi:hypothetical protein